LPYSGAKTTAAAETPSHTIAEATRMPSESWRSDQDQLAFQEES
jgi:hypothetical protein